MKISIISDVHAAKHKEFSPGGERLDDIIEALMRWENETYAFGARIAVVCGDLFHVRGVINVEVFNAVFNAFTVMRFEKIFILVGNHDQANKAGNIHSVASFAALENVEVVDVAINHFINDDLRLGFIPYMEHAEDIKTAINEVGSCDALFMHHGIHGAKVGPNDFVMKEELTADDLEGQRLIVSGHYHKSQWIQEKGPPIIIPGSPLQLNRGERNDKKGWWVWDTENKIIPWENPKFYSNNLSPKFITIDANEIDLCKDDFTNNFITVAIDDDTDTKAIEAAASTLKARGLVLRKSRPEDEIEREASAVNLDLGDTEIIKRYVEMKSGNNTDQMAIISAGLKYLNGEGQFDE